MNNAVVLFKMFILPEIGQLGNDYVTIFKQNMENIVGGDPDADVLYFADDLGRIISFPRFFYNF